MPSTSFIYIDLESWVKRNYPNCKDPSATAHELSQMMNALGYEQIDQILHGLMKHTDHELGPVYQDLEEQGHLK